MTEPFTRNITDRSRELLRGAESLVYKETPEGDLLEVYVFPPHGDVAEGRAAPAAGEMTWERPAVLFFFSSSWDAGTVTQFAPQCMQLAERGMVAMACDYRVRSKQGTTPMEAMADARSAFRWVRAHADHFGIDPGKIVGAGGAAGAQLVASAALLDGAAELEEERELEGGASCRPDAMVLFSAVLDISPKGHGMEMFPDAKAAKAASPLANVERGMPPALLFHSKGDRRVPVEGARKFAKLMKRKKNVCRLVEYDGVDHSFFNFNVDSGLFDATMAETEAFLGECGILG